jgi:hypothetical protein
MPAAKAKKRKKPAKKKTVSASSLKPLHDEVRALSGRVAHVEAFLSKLNAT